VDNSVDLSLRPRRNSKIEQIAYYLSSPPSERLSLACLRYLTQNSHLSVSFFWLITALSAVLFLGQVTTEKRAAHFAWSLMSFFWTVDVRKAAKTIPASGV